MCWLQKFRFCGGLEPPDWLLAELPLLTTLARGYDITVLCEEIADDITLQNFERVTELFANQKDGNAVAAVLRFVLQHAAKYNVSSADFALELQQLGLESSVVETISQVYETKRIQIRTQLEGERFKFPHIEKVEWRIINREASNADKAIELSLELSEPALECAALPVSKIPKAELNLTDPSSLLLNMDQDKFFALYEDLIQVQALLQSIKR
ncbi:hypothetical protein Gpo141_00012983 [Globisporangium polare]